MICSNNNLFEVRINYLRNLFPKNCCPSCYFEQSSKQHNDTDKLVTQKLKTDIFQSIDNPYYGKSYYHSSGCLICLVRKKFNTCQYTILASEPVPIFN